MGADCLSGNGRVALVSGPVGCGKTELIHTFAEKASKDGLRFQKATCSPAERLLPLGVISQLLPATPDRIARLVGNGLTELDPSVAEHAMVLHDVSRALTDLAEERPLLIGVDDVQHADAPSLDCLLYLARRVGTARVLLVLTEIDQPRTPFHSELLRERHCRRIRLAALSRRETGQLAAHLADDVHQLSGGNPLLAHALLEDHDTTRRFFGPAFREDLLACVHRSDPAVVALAAGLAVLGEDPSPTLLAQLTGVDVLDVPRTVHAMESAGLLADGWFRHPASASVVLDDLSRSELGELHLRAARLLHDQGAPAIDIARHLAAADRPLAAWAAPVLHEAAEHALREGDVEQAVLHLERAVRTGTDDKQRASIRSRLARVEWRTSPATAARHFPALLAASREGLLGCWDTVSLMRQMLWHGRFTEAAEALERTRASRSVPQAVELWLACCYPRLADRTGAAEPPGTLTADPWARATTALAQVLTGRCGEEAVVTAEQILQGARANGVSDYRVAALLALVYADRLDTAATWCDRLLAAAEGKRADTLRATLSGTRAEISVRQGDLREAARYADTALTTLDAQGWGTNLGFPLSCALLAATYSGRLDDAARLVELPVPETMFETRAGVHYLYARGQHHLATGRQHAALADFLVVGELVSSWRLDAPGFVPWRTGAAEAWLRQDMPDRARSLAFEQLDITGEGPSRARGAALRILAACEDPTRRPALLAEAAEVLELCGDRYELARASGELSRAHHALGDQRRARMVLRRAWHIAKECDALPLCRELLPDEEPHAACGADALSGAERRVAALAATGHTNREIADKLFITPSTVEQHLTRVYRKLNVKDRTDLPTDMASSA
ncbi:AAA family ATPase [Lentzea tibetensis]|uniref:AAA family ATPase n=2 Tax=Lentzea tibetensis TaxID=2591470 RepID=A0A563EVS1_9PSEU|nr:AAA family ATPase [Lentzea tibetensis]